MFLNIDFTTFAHKVHSFQKDGITYIKDPIRKKDVILQPEEMIRQCIVQYLIHEKQYPKNLIQIEKKIQSKHIIKRYDIVVYNRQYTPFLLIECKSHKVKLNQDTFDQIASYNIAVKAPYLMVSNGIKSIACKIDFLSKTYQFVKDIPSYPGDDPR